MTARARRRSPAAASSSRLPLAAGALAGAAVVAFVAWYVLAERWIYFWDQSGYWLRSVAVAERLPHDPLGALATVLGTIRRDDYNQLIVVPLAPAMALLGEGRLVYVLAVAVLYGLAAAASIALFAERAFLRPLRVPAAGVALGVVTVVLAPRLWLPVLVGLPDVAGCIVIPLVWWALRDPVAQIASRRLAGIAAALALLVVLRRWYAYWVLALLLALAAEQLFRVRDRRALLAAWARIALLGGAALLLFLLVTGSHGIAMLSADYGRMHAAYRSARPLLAAPSLLLRDFGAFWLLLAAAGAVVALRSATTRAAARLLLVQSLLVVLLFARTQNFNGHHLYLLFPQLATFAAIATATLGGARRSGRAVAAVVVALLVIDFAVQLAPGVQGALGPLAGAFGGVVHPPLVRSDLGEVARLTRTLDALTRDENSRIYVLSSSVLLNDEVLANAHRTDPSLPDLRGRILSTSHVDQRDGFPWALAQAGFVVLSDPTGFHLRPEDQRVVGVPADAIRGGRGIGRAFERLSDVFVLEDGSTVTIHARRRETSRDEIAELQRALAAPAAAAE